METDMAIMKEADSFKTSLALWTDSMLALRPMDLPDLFWLWHRNNEFCLKGTIEGK